MAQARMLLVSQQRQEEIAVKMCVLRMVDERTLYMCVCFCCVLDVHCRANAV